MKRAKSYLSLIMIIILVLSLTGCQPLKTSPEAVDGILDLTAWDFAADGNVNLNGEWEFYWQELKEPTDFGEKEGFFLSRQYLSVPSSWNTFQIDGEELGGEGYATFRLKVLLPETKEVKSLKISSIYTAHKLWVNREMLASQGTVSKTAAGAVPKHYPQIIELTQQEGELELIIQASNFNHRRGGIWKPLLLGNSDRVHQVREHQLISDLILFGGLLIIGIYHLMFFALRRKDKSPFYFGMFCVLAAVRILMVGEILFLNLFPALPQEVALKTEYLTFYIAMPLFLQFIYSLFPQEVSPRLCRLHNFIALGFSLIVLITPARIYSQLLLGFQILTILVWLYILYALILAAVRKRNGALLIIGGTLMLILTSVNDILFYSEQAGLPNLFPMGVFIFVLSQSFMLSRRFAHAYTTIEEMKDKLVSMDKLKDEFLANASHELLTPLSGIIGMTETIQESSAGIDVQQKQRLALIVSSARRLTGLVKDILEFSRLKNKDIVLDKKSLDIKRVVKAVLNLCQPLIGTKDLKLYSVLPEDLPLVEADENRLEQILYNLVGNALKFTTEGSIVVTAQPKDKFMEVIVEDTGPGISPTRSEKIFNSYEQLDELISKEYRGVGLGLTITKQLVELHGGGIRLISEVDKGSKFCFTLPLSTGKLPQAESYPGLELASDQGINGMVISKETSGKEAPGRKTSVQHVPQAAEALSTHQNILVVDDEPINLHVLANQLQSYGYAVTCCAQAQDALEKLLENPKFDLLILDVMMPDISGYEFCRLVREKYSLVQLPVLMLTIRDSQEDIIEAFEAGANDYLAKPFNRQELLARVKTLLALKKALDEILSSEMRFLQAQIKPHFLYNAINTIMGFCRRNPEQARELLDELSCYLRGKFRFGDLDKFVLFEEELELIKAYLHIEKARFGERLNVVYNIASGTNYQIPPLILQPLVENAVRHGIYPQKEGGTVEISAEDLGDTLVIKIIDNGVGMSMDKIAEVFKEQDQATGIGLKNVNRRLLSYYGQGLDITSEIEQGTTVTVTIPKNRGRR